MPVEGRGPELGAVRKGGRDLTTDGSLRGSAGSVRKLQNVVFVHFRRVTPWIPTSHITRATRCYTRKRRKNLTGAFTPSSTRYGGRISSWRRGGWFGATAERQEWMV